MLEQVVLADEWIRRPLSRSLLGLPMESPNEIAEFDTERFVNNLLSLVHRVDEDGVNCGWQPSASSKRLQATGDRLQDEGMTDARRPVACSL